MMHRLLIPLLLFTVSLVNAQTTGQLSYDIYNGTVFEQKNLTPSEGLYLKWQNGLLVNASAGGGTWGSITGTLSSQTDLQEALDAKLANSDLFNLSEDGSGNGRLRLWDETDGNWRDMTAINGGVSFSGDIYVTGTVGAGNLSGINTGDQTTITGNSGTTTAALGLKTATSTVGISTATAPSSGQVLTATSSTAANWQTPAASGVTSVTGTGTVNGITLSGTVTSTGNLTLGGTVTGLDAGSITTGTLGMANGGLSATSFTANSVLLGNGTSAFQVVAPGTTGNVLTSNGTTWTSAAPTTGANPAGSGSELQFRSSGSAFGALTSSSVSGANLTLGGLLTVTQATANTAIFSSTGYSLTGSDATTMVNLAGTWNTTGTPNGLYLDITNTASNAASKIIRAKTSTGSEFSVRADGRVFFGDPTNFGGSIGQTVGSGAVNLYSGFSSTTQVAIMANAEFRICNSASLSFSSSASTADIFLLRDAAGILAQRNSTNAQVFRIYETDSGANDEYLEFSAASGTNLIRPQATGTGTASVVRYHTTPTVWYGSGNGSPEGVHTGGIGSVYTDTANGLLYRKTSGTGSTGWVNP